MTPARDADIRAFLAAQGLGGATRVPISGDASFRRYERIGAGAGSLVLMDAPPGREDTRPFVALARHLLAQGYSPPRILAADVVNGFLLLEDLGDDTFAALLARGEGEEEALYRAAVALLADLAERPLPQPANLPDGSTFTVPAYDRATFCAGPELIPEWYLPAVLGGAMPDAAMAGFRAAWAAVWPEVETAAPVLVLRDYHAMNLMWLPDRQGLARVGLLDFQDASVGPAAYDLVSLLQDARRDVGVGLETAMIASYAALRGLDPEAFERGYRVLGAQRNARIVGLFVRLMERDGKPWYLDLLPRVWRHLEADLAHPACAPVAAWFDRWLPHARQRGDWRHAGMDASTGSR
ncbi:aminoglycoside phosphotransferase family protein [Zavarzinia sp. CC-PAN008]|uniref:aminoglycoside phosphotransferase family protein n=1 Tax=Zavarzinia sp. CC-PAN008 TaxID=3243332 RepID=UPI003F742CE1